MSNHFPPVNQIFDDLDQFRDFCRFEGKVFNEADLYKDGAPVWEQYKKYLRRVGKPRVTGKRTNNRKNNA